METYLQMTPIFQAWNLWPPATRRHELRQPRQRRDPLACAHAALPLVWAAITLQWWCNTALIRGNWRCHHWHLIGSSQNTGTYTECLLCYESHVKVTFRCSNLHDMTNSIFEITGVRVQLPEFVSWCFKPSQPQRIISELRTTFIKRYTVERTNNNNNR